MRCELKKVGWSSILVAAALITFAVIGEAQQPAKIPWIGYLAGSGSSPNQAFVRGMRDLGYVEGRTSVLSIGRRRAKERAWPILPPSWSA